jgi:myo-inositol 2-dehydrogenase / D-chiro-inositol 1-dehydrogenase
MSEQERASEQERTSGREEAGDMTSERHSGEAGRGRPSGEIGVAVLGAGRMGLTHIRTLAGIRSVRVVVVADPDPAAAERGRAIARAERTTADPLDAIGDPAVDAVVIITPTSTHAAMIEAAVTAGKAAWSEKPIALDLAETERIVEVIERSGRPVQLGFQRRYDPGYVLARERIDAGELGRIETFRALGRDTYPPSVEFLRTSGGLFLDMAVHDLDLARFLVGEVEEVQAWGANLLDDRFREAGDIDTAVTLLRFRNGALGTVETARHSRWGYDIRTEVAGSEGKVVVDAPQKTPATFSRRFGFEADHYENFPDRFEVAFRRELEAFFEALDGGATPMPGPEEALETLRLAVAVTRSWREGRPVRVADVVA